MRILLFVSIVAVIAILPFYPLLRILFLRRIWAKIRTNGFSRDVEAYIGKIIWATPIRREGLWGEPGDARENVQWELPTPFRLKLLGTTVLTSRGRCRGAVGRVEDPEHIYDGLWIVFVPLSDGSWNFTTRVGMCQILLGSVEPDECSDLWKRNSER